MSAQCLPDISMSIEEKCIQAGFKKTKAAESCGIGKDFFSNMKKGSYPSLDKIILLADFLGISVDELIGRNPPQNITIGNVTGNNSGNAGNTNCSFGATPEEVPEEALEISKMLKSLNFKDRAALMSLIAEFVENHKK